MASPQLLPSLLSLFPDSPAPVRCVQRCTLALLGLALVAAAAPAPVAAQAGAASGLHAAFVSASGAMADSLAAQVQALVSGTLLPGSSVQVRHASGEQH